MGSEGLGPNDQSEAIKHGTLSVGIGLAETLQVLLGNTMAKIRRHRNWGEKLSLICPNVCGSSRMNLISTLHWWQHREGLSGRFVKIDREQFGIIPNVTDKGIILIRCMCL